MIIARLIKHDTSLYKSVREKMRFLDYLFVMRPTLFFPIWIMVIAGASAWNGSIIEELFWSKSIDWLGVFLVTGLTLIAGATFIQNQIVEEKSFKLNHKISLLEKKYISRNQAISLNKKLLIFGFILILFFSIYKNFILGKQQWLVIIWTILIYFIWGILYNHDDFKWSSKPLLGILAHGFIGLCCFMVGWNYSGGDFIIGLKSSIPYVLSFAAVSMLTTIPDQEGDKQIGKITFAVRFGTQLTIFWGSILVTLSVIIGYNLKDPVISTASMIALPFFIVALIIPKMSHVLRAIRYPIFILGMFISARYPYFLVPLIFTFYLAKIYYYFRFNIDYPTFQVPHD